MEVWSQAPALLSVSPQTLLPTDFLPFHTKPEIARETAVTITRILSAEQPFRSLPSPVLYGTHASHSNFHV